jgi:hypothetical protein
MLGALVVTLAAAAPGPGRFFSAEGEAAARMAYGLEVPVAKSREATVRAFLTESAAAFGLGRDDVLTLVSDSVDLLVFERSRAGVSVLGAEVKASFDPRGRLAMVYVGAPLPPAQGSFLIDASGAERAAARGIESVQAVEARRVWLRERPAWLVRFTRAQPFEPFRAFVDAETGRLLYRVSERLSAGQGDVYDVSPAKGPVVRRSLGGLPGGATTLVGARAVGRDCSGAAVGGSCMSRAMANATGDFVYPPNPGVSTTDLFAEVMGYFQTDKFSAWIASLDAGTTLPALDVFTNVGGSGSNQGYFLGNSPLGGGRYGIELGQGPQADWAYEGDVIYHELGHGVVERSAQFGFYGLDGYGVAGEAGSLNEGSADCMALGFSNDAVLGDFIGPYLLDAGSLTTPYLRRLDSVFTCHGYDGNLDGGNPGRFGEIHDDGRILGSFFWALHTRSQALGLYAASAAFVRALRSVNSTASFHDLALALEQQMTMLFGTSAGQLVRCLQCEREIPSCDTRTRRMYGGETHESRLIGDDLGVPAMANGERPSTFQYELGVPSNTVVTFDRFAITGGALPKVYARFGSRVSWTGGTPSFDVTITGTGQMLPAKPAAGTWYLQGVLTDPANGTRRYGMRAQVPGGVARPPSPNVSCTLGGGVGPCTCTPSCTGRCNDGCGGLCPNVCDAGTVCNMGSGACECVRQCAGRACGPDGCGGSCGSCANGTCNDTTGVCEGCVPVCPGKQCGPNGCGQACGQCTGLNEICDLPSGQCVDAGALDMPDAGDDGGTGGSGGGGQEVKGGCGCAAGPSAALLLGFLLLSLSPVRVRRSAKEKLPR